MEDGVLLGILGLYGDNEEEIGNYYTGLYRVWGLGLVVSASDFGISIGRELLCLVLCSFWGPEEP